MRDALALYGAARGGTFRTQRPAVARAFWTLLDERKEHSIRKLSGTTLRRVPTYEIDAPFGIAPRKPTARCDRRMELRGAFLACGSIASPARGYHLEFVPPAEAAAVRLLALLRADRRSPKTAERKNKTVIYFKDADEIVRLLTAIGAYNAVLHLEDVRALKETKNRIHRLVNTEAANVERAAGAAAAQRNAIELVADAYGLANLSRPLREVAELRLAHPSETLAELGRRCDPQAKKSTVNGRIAAIVRLARSLAQKAGSAAKGTVSD
ncbi:MAG: DNA-binding protein WhiA [Candidatus Eremiobacteraeota bacterium]|nr:DNA-binding protein WhiA [Candidatus Eremiobacteraeota bacterium]